eukprot:2767978-Amphidinium_carterae.1
MRLVTHLLSVWEASWKVLVGIRDASTWVGCASCLTLFSKIGSPFSDFPSKSALSSAPTGCIYYWESLADLYLTLNLIHLP